MRLRSVVLAALCIPGAVSAQTIRGTVVEYGTQTRIAGATIEVISRAGRTVTTMSDSTGAFVVYPPTAGRVLLRASHPSYVADRTDTLTANPKETVTVVVGMTRQAIPIAAITVTARSSSVLGGFYERQRRNAFGTYIDATEIERKNPVSVAHLMRAVHGLVIADSLGSTYITLRGRDPAGPVGTELPFGTERCAAAIYIDGMPMAAGADVDLDALMPVHRIAAVEVYPDATAVPFEFTAIGNDCGAVAFWLKPAKNSPVTWKRITIAALAIGAMVAVEAFFLKGKKADISDSGVRDFTLLERGTGSTPRQYHRMFLPALNPK